MDAEDVRRYIVGTFDGIDVMTNEGDTFFVYDPLRNLPPERQQPFATIVTGDHYDTVSALDRPGAYRLNLGLTKQTYVARFGTPPTVRDEHSVLVSDVDYAAVDTLMPHPVYASQYWISIIEPSETNWPVVRGLLAEAHGFAARKHANHEARRSSTR